MKQGFPSQFSNQVCVDFCDVFNRSTDVQILVERGGRGEGEDDAGAASAAHRGQAEPQLRGHAWADFAEEEEEEAPSQMQGQQMQEQVAESEENN